MRSRPITWTCPACKTYIRHERETPRPRQTYRCHVCRLELVVDDTEGKLTVTPLPFELSRPQGR